MYKCAIIMAAGEGKRMKSSYSKVLHKVCGKEMVNHVIDVMRNAGMGDIDVVVGRSAEEVKKATQSRQVSYSLQAEQLGTGHAVKCGSHFLEGKRGVVAVFTGDAPLVRVETVVELLKKHENEGFSATLLTAVIEDGGNYGRIVRNSLGEVERIVEAKDCTEEERQIKEINAGMYVFDIEKLVECLGKLKNDNAQGEYYLTDVIGILREDKHKVGAVIADYEETLGVNSRVELAQAEEVLKNRINRQHMENGVTLIDPSHTYIGADVSIGKDTVIYPGNILEGKTLIGESCVLYQNSRISNSVIANGVEIQSSVIIDSNIGENTTVGPFAYVRPESSIGSNVRIGDFVEIKKSVIGNGTKVSHLTYIGDAKVGENCNFGCGTVVVNYDGKNKYKTVIGNNAFIGCNTNLVSPVEVKDNSYIAAGSTITKEVPDGALAIARARQINIEGWVDKKNLRKK